MYRFNVNTRSVFYGQSYPMSVCFFAIISLANSPIDAYKIL